jgi:spermidine synthase
MYWKTLAGRCIYKSSSGLKIFDNYLYRWLQFDSNALQTLLYKRKPERAGLYYVLPLILAARAKPGPTCMLGLGGGGVAHALSPFLGLHPLTAVEIDEEVIAVASQFFMMPQLKNIKIIQADASVFVRQEREVYQHLIVDLFNAHTFPSVCYNEEFFANCKNTLASEGILAVNLANRHEQWPIYNLIKNQFSGITVVIPVKKCANLIVLACRSESRSPLINVLTNIPQLKKLTWNEKWGCMAQI